MSVDGAFGGVALLWLIALVLALCGRGRALARAALTLGAWGAAALCAWRLPAASPTLTLFAGPSSVDVHFMLPPAALWLLLFGGIAAGFATALGSPSPRWRSWCAGAALCLLGALGCFGLRDAASFLVAWEVMSLGGAVLLLGERLGETRRGHGLLFMLALLEVGAVALLAALLMLTHAAGSPGFAAIAAVGASLPGWQRLLAGVLLLVGFGAKLGLLPFYEWYPAAYGQGSGASGALLSGVVLNAAFFTLARAFTAWLPGDVTLAVIIMVVAVLSAVLAIMYAFQEGDWRRLLAFSTAENAAVAVTTLGACVMFRSEGQQALAALAFVVGLLHLAGHALAKGAMMLAADAVARAGGGYALVPRGWLRRGGALFGVGVVFAGMSLAAMPPQAGFVSEWFTFQTLFQGFHLHAMAGRLTLSLAGAGMALTAAVALATFVKIIGLGVLGADDAGDPGGPLRRADACAVGLLGLGVLALAVGMPWWLHGLDGATAARFAGAGEPVSLHQGLVLVPLTSRFAFISPTKLVIVCPLLALLPLLILWRARRRHRVRRAPVWFGGLPRPARGATTSLAFSHALRTFYSFIYRPVEHVRQRHRGREYFIESIDHHADVAPLFEAAVFRWPARAVQRLSEVLSPLQSGHMNAYLGMVGVLLVIILALGLA